jgi:RHS repeat-associated protein
LHAQAVHRYAQQGRVYQDQVSDVGPTDGALANSALLTNHYHNHRGEQMAVSAPGGLWTRTSYDGAGRPTFGYSTDGAGGVAWSAAASVRNDTVLEQTQQVYDGAGNVIETVRRQRFDNATGTGPLGNPTTSPTARVSYTAAYYDAADRLTASVDVGTNQGVSWTRPSSVPARSDTVLVTSYQYNAAGWVQDVLDPRELSPGQPIDTRTTYDALGRTTKTVLNYTGNPETAQSDVATVYSYDGSNHVLKVQADEPGGNSEQTQYVYGVTTAGGSAVNSNDLLAQVRQPNKADGTPSTAVADQENYSYNALGQTTVWQQRNRNAGLSQPQTHSYVYDVLGRLTSDQVTVLGDNVDGSVRRIDTAYDGQGNPYLLTGYNAVTISPGDPTPIVNQVQRQYNGLGQLTAEYQSHQAHQAVNTSTTLAVQYGYTEMAGGVNNSRLTSLTYPSVVGDSSARVLNYNYNSGLDSNISRLSSLSDSGIFLESYLYLGLGTVVERDHPQTGTNLTYISQTGGTGDGGDRYVGLDRFGRVVDQNWYNSNPANAKEEYQYSYDRDSNRLSRQDVQHPLNNETYSYDALNQLASFQRGSHSQSWTPDALGNFSTVTTTDNGVPQTQNRTHNQQNELINIGTPSLVYDNNGNLTQDNTTGPSSVYTYDAWNRLVSATTPNGSVTYQYDALGRRVIETRAATTDLYYSSQWQVLEERTGGMSPTRLQYVWSPVYVDALVARDSRDPSTGALLQRLYAVQDANWNVTAVVNTSSQEVERYVYDPYGAVTVITLIGPSPHWAYLFQGGRQDTTTGLSWFRARDYSPTLMRWLQQDPLGFGAGDGNLYRDVGNGPTNATDPLGLSPLGTTWNGFVNRANDTWQLGRDVFNLGMYNTTSGATMVPNLFGAGLPVWTPTAHSSTFQSVANAYAEQGDLGLVGLALEGVAGYMGQMALTYNPVVALIYNGYTDYQGLSDWWTTGNETIFERTGAAGFDGLAILVTTGLFRVGSRCLRGGKPLPVGEGSPGLQPTRVGGEGAVNNPVNKLPVKPQHPDVGASPKNPLSQPASPSLEPGTYVFVQDADGVVHVVPNGPHLHPGVLGGGQSAAAAGEIVINAEGVVTQINNISFTFQHDASVLAGVQAALEQVGLTVAPNAIKPFSY